MLWPLTLTWAVVITGAEVGIVTSSEGGEEGVTLTVKAVTCGSETVIVPGKVPVWKASGVATEVCPAAIVKFAVVPPVEN